MLSFLTALAAAFLPVILVWAGAVDLLTRSIPNSLVLLLAVSFAFFAIVAGLPLGQILAHFICAAGVLLLGFALYTRSFIGGGDAKLLAGAALWFGFENILPLFAGTALAGGALALAYLAAHEMRWYPGFTQERVATIPYGAAIAAGGLAALPEWLAGF